MSDINFSCPYCQNPLVVEDEGAGMEIPCPVCAKEITIPLESAIATGPADEVAAGVGEMLMPELPVTEEELDRLAAEILRRTRSGDAAGGARMIKRQDGGRDIAFHCPQCKTRLVVDVAGAGIEIPCPACETELSIPDPVKDAESFLASALASRLGSLADTKSDEVKPPPLELAKKPEIEPETEPLPAIPEEPPLASGRTRIALKPKLRTRKAVEGAPQSGLPFMLPQGVMGKGGLAGLTEEMVKAGTAGSGYMIVPIQTPDGPAAMITQAPKADETSGRKRPRYPRKYSELAAKLRSAAPADGEGDALGELQKRGPLVSKVLAQHFIEKALEESGELEKTEEDASAPTESGAHKGALKSPQRLDLQGTLAVKERASRQVTGVSGAPKPAAESAARHGRHHRSHSHHGHHGQQPKSKHKALTILALLAGLITISALIYQIKVEADMSMAEANRPNDKVQPPTEVGLKGEENVFLSKLEQNTARETVQQFCSAASWEAQLPFIRQRERVEPLMRDYYKEREYKQVGLQETRMGSANYNRGMLLVSVNAVITENYQELPFLLERKPDGTYLVDWEFVVEYNPLTWENFRKLRSTEESTFRLMLTPADYYNFEFADSVVYQSFKIEDRQTGFVGIYAFAKRDSEVARRLEDEMRTTLPLPCMVKLKYPPNAQVDTVVEITEWVRKGWMVLPESGAPGSSGER